MHRDSYSAKLKIIGGLIILTGLVSLVFLLKAVGQTLLILIAVIVTGVFAAKVSDISGNGGKDSGVKSPPRGVNSEGMISRGFKKWWRS